MTHRLEPVLRAAAGPLAALHHACFPDDPWDARAIEQIIGIPGFFGRIAWEQKDPVGFVLALGLGKETEIVSLGVAIDYRRAGIGSALLDCICFEARPRARRRVENRSLITGARF